MSFIAGTADTILEIVSVSFSGFVIVLRSLLCLKRVAMGEGARAKEAPHLDSPIPPKKTENEDEDDWGSGQFVTVPIHYLAVATPAPRG
jgi:hypothetical protein